MDFVGLVKMRRIKATEIAADVQSGTGGSVLMEKYNLSEKQLGGVLEKMAEGG